MKGSIAMGISGRKSNAGSSRAGVWWRLGLPAFVLSLLIVWFVSGETAQDGSVYMWTSVVVLVVGCVAAALVGRSRGARIGAAIAIGFVIAAIVEFGFALIVAITPGS